MKPIYKIILVYITFLCSTRLFAQPGHNIVKQTKGINGILKATANARIHANSNSVFGAANNPTNYSKKDQRKKDEIKIDKEVQKNNKVKKQKK
ncbi:MAG: hypothetical protein ABIW34_01405 [Ginsengibacter sp.]